LTVRRLVPDAAETTLDDQVGSLDFASQAHSDRPYLVTNFALTLDGHATIEGRSGKIGSKTDTAMLVGLRTRADALMIGAGTMRAERYGPVGPLMVIVSGRLDLPWDAPLFTEGGGEVLVFTYSDAEPPETETPVHIERHEDAVDLTRALAYLRTERGVRSVLCEGGPRLHAQLVDAGLVDELFVTHAPKLGGGAGPGLVVDLDEVERPLEVAWLLYEDETGEVFARYVTGA
jgi:5-amino-6-(5-phosphoribosylamino)uracil reductase